MIKLYIIFILLSILYTFYSIFIGNKEVRNMQKEKKSLEMISAHIVHSMSVGKTP